MKILKHNAQSQINRLSVTQIAARYFPVKINSKALS